MEIKLKKTIQILIIIFAVLTHRSILGQNALRNNILTYQMSDIAAAQCMQEQTILRISFQDHYFTKEMMTKGVGFNWAHKGNHLIAIIKHDGYAKFGTLETAIGYGRRFGDKFSISLLGIYVLSHATHYPTLHSWTINLSAFANLTENIWIAIDLYNPTHNKYLTQEGSYIPSRFLFQVGYVPNSKLGGSVFCNKELPAGLELGLNLYYHPIEKLIFTGVFSSQQIGIHIQTNWNRFICRVEASWNYKISSTTALEFYYQHAKQNP